MRAPILLTVRETAARLHMSESGVRELIKVGALRAGRKGLGSRSALLIDEHAIADYRSAREQALSAAPRAVREDIHDDTFR